MVFPNSNRDFFPFSLGFPVFPIQRRLTENQVSMFDNLLIFNLKKGRFSDKQTTHELHAVDVVDQAEVALLHLTERLVEVLELLQRLVTRLLVLLGLQVIPAHKV